MVRKTLLIAATIISWSCTSEQPARGPDSSADAAEGDVGDAGLGPDVSNSDAVTESPDTALDGDRVDASDVGVPFQSGTLVQTADGPVQGEVSGGLRVFKGIPFAAAPIAERRFRAPEPNEPWSETFDATALGPACVQQSLIPGTPTSEDCLTLNVWTHDDERARPVMVWIHGGGYINGSGRDAVYDGAALAENGDVVVITINYRLGPLGYLALPELAAEDPDGSVGNYGSLDQVQALDWIKTNAAAFGGDSENVTIFGESAGGFSVCQLVGSPLADGLFHKAIVQSGGCNSAVELTDPPFGPSAYASGALFTERVGCANAPNALACLRAVDASDFAVDPAVLGSLLEAEMAFAPTIDGHFLSESPHARILRGDAPNRPMILGSNGNEGALFTTQDVVLTTFDLEARFRGMGLGDDAVTVLMNAYAFAFLLPKSAWDAFFGELFFNCNSYHIATQAPFPTYAYHLMVAPALLSTLQGPLHVADVPYVFGNFDAFGIVPTFVDLDMRDRVQAAWASFAHLGVPEFDPVWPTATQGQFLEMGLVHSVQDVFRFGRCDVLRDVGLTP